MTLVRTRTILTFSFTVLFVTASAMVIAHPPVWAASMRGEH